MMWETFWRGNGHGCISPSWATWIALCASLTATDGAPPPRAMQGIGQVVRSSAMLLRKQV